MKTPITVWEYYEAPAELQISNNGGDEDWIAELPPEYHDWPPSWLDSGDSFGCCCVDVYQHPTKQGWKLYIVYIGCHA